MFQHIPGALGSRQTNPAQTAVKQQPEEGQPPPQQQHHTPQQQQQQTAPPGPLKILSTGTR